MKIVFQTIFRPDVDFIRVRGVLPGRGTRKQTCKHAQVS